MNAWNWNGARWWKFDFHTHTPASDDYGKGLDQAILKNRTCQEWLLDYMRAGIDCVAITDHNSGAWIDQLQRAYQALESDHPDDFRSLYLFPGVEISVHGGVHVLAIFDQSTRTSDIDSLLGAVKFRGNKGSSDAVTECSFTEAVNEIVRRGGIAIPAHVDESKGLFNEFSGTTLQQALECEPIMAMEIMEKSVSKPQLYLARKLKWTEVLGSDAHHSSGSGDQRFPGRYFTWIKMGTPTLEGLRLAVLDGPLSVKRSDEQTDDPNQHAASAIESIEISQARYLGRSEPFRLELNPWLNTIIGGRGTGKSTIVEFLRLLLRRDKELPQTLQEDFAKYHKAYLSRSDDGLLTENSCFSAIYRKHGTRYRVQWSQRGDAEPIEVEDHDGSWLAEQGEVAQRFPVRTYSQKQIFELAKAPLALLRIVDDAPEIDRRSWEDRWKMEESRYLSLKAKAREIQSGLADEPRLIGELEDVKRKLLVFEKAGHADILKQYQQRLRQERVVEEWEESWIGASQRIRNLADEILPSQLDISFFDPNKPEDKYLIEKTSLPLSQMQQVCTDLLRLATFLDEAVTNWRSERDKSQWKQAVRTAISRYQSLLEKLKREAATDPSAYGELVQRRQILEGRLKELESQRKQLESVLKEAEESLDRVIEIRRELTKRRRDFLNKVLKNNRYVRIDILPYEARETVESEFRKILQREGGGFEKDIGLPDNNEGFLGELYTSDSTPSELEKRLTQLKHKLKNIASGKLKRSNLRDQRFAVHLEKLVPEVFDRLDLWFPEDSLRVEYSTMADGTGFRSIHEGSPGQKTAALLAFLLSYGDEPIILDQPEDDLDNRLIYDLIVTQLRNIKQRRQVIVVTHNANIVVNGDAELVVGLIASSGETHQECSGSLQTEKVRDTICAVMEGGKEAFEQRYKRITLEAHHV